MKTDGGNKKFLVTPRSMGIFFVQFLGATIIITALIIVIGVITSPVHLKYSDYAILIVGFTILPLLVGFLMIYLPQQYRTWIVFDGDTKILQKIKKGTEPQQFDLTDAKMIIAKVIQTIPGCKFSLSIEDNSEYSTLIFKEDTNPTIGAKHWLAFTAKIAEMTMLPLEKEYYAEQMNGSLLLLTTSGDKLTVNNRHTLLIISVPFIISLIGASIYIFLRTTKLFVLAGGCTVAINMILTFLYAFLIRKKALLNRDKRADMFESNIIIIIFYFTLVIPYSFYYLFCILLLSGFRWPFY